MPPTSLRALPSVDRIVTDTALGDLHARELLTNVAREAVDAARRSVADGGAAPAFEELLADVRRRYEAAVRAPVRRIVNATGVILHTNLGRAPLADEAIEAMVAISGGYTNLEFDMASGARGSRHTILEPLLRRLTGAEAAMAVNNNASAVLLALAALAAGNEVVVSRGQLVEIGGGFRIPDVMRQSRARLVEVGTTNRTRAADFAAAIGPKTAAVMRVHPSNFKISGFTETPSLGELASVSRNAGVLLIDDLGSGCLLDTTAYGLPLEPTPQASIAAAPRRFLRGRRSRPPPLPKRDPPPAGPGVCSAEGSHPRSDGSLVGYLVSSRGVAQLGSAPEWGSGGPAFELRHPDHSPGTNRPPEGTLRGPSCCPDRPGATGWTDRSHVPAAALSRRPPESADLRAVRPRAVPRAAW